ncbi:hypothetical protein L596_015730 [Steinernema carpocapsae]|uniref:Potassium channel domain-containing protein n=1 Tax=Steinernema carpocapsae TaxID=34508 RepID=A0A4U5NFW6_STECR|nr:hypothetical protein L596_015730 [Steinernema carpocapsae]
MLRRQADKLIDLTKAGLHALVPVIILFIFTLIGALIFYVIEEPNEAYELRQLATERAKLREDTAFRLNIIKNLKGVEAYNETVRSLDMYRDGLGVDEVDLDYRKWNFWNSAYYAMTIYTTIGYGDISPVTRTGKIFTIIYAFIGIPIALITLVYLGSLFAKVVIIVWDLIIKASGCMSKDLQDKMKKIGPYDSVQKLDYQDSEVLLQFPVTALIAYVTVYILIVAWIFTLWENWDYGSSLYFSLISFLTIGFGDITPNTSDWTQVFTMFLILVGLAIVSTVLTIIQKQIEALANGMTGSIDDEYAQAVQEMEDEGDTGSTGSRKSIEEKRKESDVEKQVKKEEEAGKPKAMDKIYNKMSLKSRFLYNMMPEDRRKQLERHAEKRQAVKTRGTQTDAYLMSRKKTLSE